MSRAKRVVVSLFCVLILLGGAVTTYASGNDDVLNLQRRVDAIAVGAGDIWRQAFDDVRDGGSQVITIPDVSPGNAGAVLGYGRNDQGLLEWMFGGIVSQDSVATSYTALRNIRAEAAEGTVEIAHAVVRSTIRVVDEDIVEMFELPASAFTDFSPFLPGDSITIYNNGGLRVSSSGGDTHFLNDGSSHAYTRFPLRIHDQGGLSTISMYNFINSRFSDTGIAMFSPYRSPSIFTAHTIASVSPVGTSGVAVLNVIQAIVQMFALGLLGVLFGLAMFFGAFKTGLAVLASVPATLIGSIRGFARLITNTFLLITQVVATVFLYVLIGDILLALGDVVTSLISGLGGIA